MIATSILFFDSMLPSALILSLACITILLTVFCRSANRAMYFLTQIGLIAALFFVLKQNTFFLHPLSVAYHHFQVDALSIFGAASVLILSFFSLSFAYKELLKSQCSQGEFYVLCLFSILGMLVMVSASHLLTFYIAIELMSFPLYILCAYYRSSNKGSEAALKYFVTGALASGFLLYGMSLIYGATKNLGFHELVSFSINLSNQDSLLFVMGLAFILAGFAFKLGLAPFHMWLADVYQGAPSAVVTFISGAPKVATFIVLIRLFQPILSAHFSSIFIHSHHLFSFLAIASLLIGNLAALAQKNLLRLLAYSSIGQMGFIIMGFLSASSQGLSASLFYVLTYAFVSVGVFGIISSLNTAGFALEKVKDLAGLSQRSPLIAFVFLLLIFSMAGIPPLLGFMAKFSILLDLIHSHCIMASVLVAFVSLISLYYYLYIIKVMYFDEFSGDFSSLCLKNKLSIFIITALVVYFGLFPQSLFYLSSLVISKMI